jgi:hypothetical protein
MFKKTLLAAVLSLTAVSAFATEGVDKSTTWSNIYVDGIHSGFSDETGEHDVAGQVGVEGGFDYDKLSMYGFAEHNFTDNAEFFKLSGHYTVLDTNVTLYSQATHFQGEGFDSQTGVLGLGYKLGGDGWSVKPFIGYNVNSDGNQEDGGVMVGWSGFKVIGTGLSVSSWHETVVTDEITANGAVGIWQDISQRVYVGAHYAYHFNTRGNDGYGDALLLRIGMHL